MVCQGLCVKRFEQFQGLDTALRTYHIMLKDIVEQICTPLEKVINLSLEEGIVNSEWKEANITPLFKKGSRNK